MGACRQTANHRLGIFGRGSGRVSKPEGVDRIANELSRSAPYRFPRHRLLEAGARALSALHGADPDAPALKQGQLVPTWHIYTAEAHAVLAAADSVDTVTPEMERAGVAAMKAGSQDAGSLVQRIWLAMTALRPGACGGLPAVLHLHGRNGWTLDRSMHADVCNTYFCHGLGDYVRSCAAPESSIVIAGNDEATQVSLVLMPPTELTEPRQAELPERIDDAFWLASASAGAVSFSRAYEAAGTCPATRAHQGPRAPSCVYCAGGRCGL